MIQLILDNYKTYTNRSNNKPERHWLRLLILFIAAIFFGRFGYESLTEVYSVLVTCITILTGFTFTALFSDHSVADIGLTKPKNENDRRDIAILSILGENFKIRSSYFITISIITAVLMTLISIQIVLPPELNYYLDVICQYSESCNGKQILLVLEKLQGAIAIITASIAVFLYFECLYTFYRMSETILSIINMRREYIRHAEDQTL